MKGRVVWVVDGDTIHVRLGKRVAQVMTIPPKVKYQGLFLKLQRQAREAGRELWSGT